MNEALPISNISDQLAVSFVPSLLRKQYSDNPDRKLGSPLKEDYASSLWIDIVNFSTLCNRLMKDTVNGVEKLTGILQEHYDFILNTIVKYGGQPLFFAGDGLMSCWAGNQETAKKSVALAAACAKEIQEKRSTKDDLNELISIHAIVSLGPLQLSEFEGINGKFLFSFSGEVFTQLTLAARNRAANNLLISDIALACLDNNLNRIPVEYDTSILMDSPIDLSIPVTVPMDLTKQAIEKLKSYVPGTLIFPLNRDKLKWIAEIRPVTTVFLRLPNSSTDAKSNLSRINESVALIVPLVQKFNGLINQVWLDEKQANMLICFGPPPSSHVDNPERGALLAIEIQQTLQLNNLENSIGVSSGMAYCGILGNDNLRQYTVIGDVVNLSARLSGVNRNTIYCDKSTYSSSKNVIVYKDQELVKVKGLTEEIAVYSPEKLLEEEKKKPNIHFSIGRNKEFSILMDKLNHVINGEREIVIIEGESGMGKSKLLSDFIKSTNLMPVAIFAGTGDFSLRNIPYAALSNFVLRILRIDELESGKNQTEVYDELIRRFGSNACLLNITLKTSIPDSEEVRSLTGSQRVKATHDFLLGLFEQECKKEPVVIIFDDAQWVDELTWKLLESMHEKINNCFLVLAFQKMDGLSHIEYFLEQGAGIISLQELSDADLDDLICTELGVSEVSNDVTSLIRKIAKGNPFFCIELTGSLVNQELLFFENNRCSLIKEASSIEISLPETVRGAIRGRIDRLGQGSQLSLKVGSIVGNRFAEKIISSIYPIVNERQSVSSYLHEVEQYGFLKEAQVDNLDGYHFNNATIVEVAYEMTLSEQRRQLHKESAEWYEKNFKGNLLPFYLRLANHWSEANEKEKASYYYELEAIRLFRLGYAKEAINIGLQGIEILGQPIPRDLPTIGQQIGENFGAIGALMQGKTIEGLVNHHTLNDPLKEKLIKLLLALGPLAHQSQQGELFALMTIICQRLTLEHGNGKSSAEVYAMFSIIYKALTKDAETAYAWGQLAIVIDKLNGHTLQSRVIFMNCWFISLWKLPLSDLIPISYKGADAGFKTGDILYACFNLSLTVVLKSVSGVHLNEVRQTAIDHFIRNNQTVINAAYHLIHEEQVAKAFQGLTAGYTSLTDEKFNEEKDIASICQTDLFNQIAYYLVSKLKLNFHFGNWEEAVSWGERSVPLIPAFDSQPGYIEFEQYYTMAALYRASETEGEVSSNFSLIANSGIEKLNSWAGLCSTNFLHKALLSEAIREALKGDLVGAEKKFLLAAEKASDAGFTQDKGLAYEHLARMKKRHGESYLPELQSSIEAYTQWGANAKVNYLNDFF